MMNMMKYLLKKLLAFFLLYLGAAVLGELLIIGGLYAFGFDPLHGIMPPGALGGLLPYYGFIVFLLAAVLYCRFAEKRDLSSMGFTRHAGDYIIGMVIAALLLLLIIGICCLTKTIFYTGINQNIDAVYLIALFIGLMIQGAAEEALCRGFLMQSLLKKAPVPLAILLSSTAFAVPHIFTLAESDWIYALIGIVNLYLISAIFSLLILCRMNLWISCGLHTAWNFLLYGIFGLTLSGSHADMPGVFLFEMRSLHILTRGAYGIEAGIAATAILIPTLFILIIIYRRRCRHGIS